MKAEEMFFDKSKKLGALLDTIAEKSTNLEGAAQKVLLEASVHLFSACIIAEAIHEVGEKIIEEMRPELRVNVVKACRKIKP